MRTWYAGSAADDSILCKGVFSEPWSPPGPGMGSFLGAANAFNTLGMYHATARWSRTHTSHPSSHLGMVHVSALRSTPLKHH